jgi:hypothetical protein
MAALGTGSSGLDDEEAAERLARDGQNALPRVARRPWYLEFLENFIHLFALLLWTGAGLAWLAGMPQLAWAMLRSSSSTAASATGRSIRRSVRLKHSKPCFLVESPFEGAAANCSSKPLKSYAAKYSC